MRASARCLVYFFGVLFAVVFDVALHKAYFCVRMACQQVEIALAFTWDTSEAPSIEGARQAVKQHARNVAGVATGGKWAVLGERCMYGLKKAAGVWNERSHADLPPLQCARPLLELWVKGG